MAKFHDNFNILITGRDRTDQIRNNMGYTLMFTKKVSGLTSGFGRRHFCSTKMSGTNKIFCNHDRSSVGSCNLVQYQGDLPDIYQNFDTIEGVSARDTGNVMCNFFKKNLI